MDKSFYDLMVVFKESQERKEKVISEITNIIKKDGEIEKIDEWGIRTLAYPIKKQTRGFYLLIRFKANPMYILEISKALRIDEVLRFLVVKRKRGIK